VTQRLDGWRSIASSRIVDLAHPIESGMPVSPNHPGFRIALTRRHGDTMRADGGSAASELMMLGGHTGTHVDALCHVSHNGRLFADVDAAEAQRGGLFKSHGAETIPIVVSRGVLLDVAALHRVSVLDAGYPITSRDLEDAAARQNVVVEPGDAVLVRSGWSAHWKNPERFLGAKDGAPGPDESAARWLVERGVRLTGGETIAYECIPPGRGHALLPVHRILLVEHGVHIVEAMTLDELAAAGRSEFLFIMTPMKVVGATGVPVRPVAVIP
jgi:kynurenine formamidase